MKDRKNVKENHQLITWRRGEWGENVSCRRLHMLRHISTLGYWQKVNQSPTQTETYNTSSPWNGGIFMSRPDIIRVDVSPTRSSKFLGSRESIYQTLNIRKFTFVFLKSVFHGGHEIRTHGQQLRSFRRRHTLRHWSVGLPVKG